jgi:hypothetical protein
VVQGHTKIHSKRCASLVKVIAEYQEMYPQMVTKNTKRM